MVKRSDCLAGLIFFLAFGITVRALRAQAPPRGTAADTGQISGTISFQGQKPELRRINMKKDPVCASLHSGPVLPEDGRVNPDDTLPNAFVYLQSNAKLPSTPPRNPAILTQKGCEYQPYVVGVMVGQPFEIINLDPTTHNVHVMPKNNPEWNVSQQPGSPSIVRKFQHPEIMIPTDCNVHPWMKAYIGVVDNPFYAVTGSGGVFTLRNIPPGEYTLNVWTAAFGTRGRRITVRAGETTTANFTFGGQ